MGLIHYIKKKRRIRRRHKSYSYGKSGVSKLHFSYTLPVIKLSALVAGVAAVVCLAVFVVVPAIQGKNQEPEGAVPQEFEVPSYDADAKKIEGSDFSELQRSTAITSKTINDPFLYGDELIYSAATAEDGVSKWDKLYIYNIQTEESQKVEGITMKFDNILSPMLSEDYLVWIDSNEDGGGRICGYDRQKNEQFLVKEYAFAVPEINIYDNLIIFMQQAGDDLDRLYLYDLNTRESVTKDTFSGRPAVISAADISGNDLVYAVPYTSDGQVLSRIVRYNFETQEEEKLEFDTYVYKPKTDGNSIVFSTNNGAKGPLYLIRKDAEPVMIEEDVLNYDIGEGFVAFTKDDAVYIYIIENGRKARLSSDKTRGLLASVNKNEVCWYDVTGGYDEIDVVKYAKVVW